MGTYYPVKDDPYFDSSECPLFWRHHKIPVVPVNLTNEDYIIVAMTGISFNIIAVFISTIFLINGLRKNDDFVDGLEEMNKPKDKRLDDPNSVPLTVLIWDQNPDHVPKSGPLWIFRPSMLVGDSKIKIASQIIFGHKI